MRCKPFHLALLLFQAFWLNVVLPGHTRGVVALPGSGGGCETMASASAPSGGSCCSTADRRATSRDSKSVPAKRAAQCAVCAYAVRVTPPPVVDLTPPPAGLLELLPPPVPRVAARFDFVPTYLGRAPPAAC